MWRTAILFFVFIAPVVMGVLILATMLIPWLQTDLGTYIVIAAAVGFVLAIPISYVAAKNAPGQPS